MTSTVDAAEIRRFEAMAADWWSPTGKFRSLHRFNPTRVGYVKARACAHFDRDPRSGQALAGLRMLDIGCGGGLLSEPMARLGADLVSADASALNIEIARVHAAQSGLDIDYRATTAEALADAGERFDVVLAMEIIEHVSDVPLFVDRCAAMVRPGGLLFIATLNRTAKAFALAIVGAEYVLGWVPRGTHDWSKFLKPEEVEAAIRPTGLVVSDRCGVTYSPLADRWSLDPRDLDVNYMMVAERPAGEIR